MQDYPKHWQHYTLSHMNDALQLYSPCPLHLAKLRETATSCIFTMQPCRESILRDFASLDSMLLAQHFYISKKGCVGLAQCIPALLESVLRPIGFMNEVIVASM